MKTSMLVAATVACVLSAPVVFAQEHSAPAQPAMGMDMDKQMAQMQNNMKKMQQQMDKIAATTDPKARQKLMQEHMQTMQENMKMMRGMGGPTMTGRGERGGMEMGGQKGGMAMGDDMKPRQDMLEKRMDMMQMMMEQMIQRDQGASKPAPMGHM